jgi:hypothetical protein
MNDKIIGKPTLSNSGHIDSRKNTTKRESDNSFIYGRKVDSPKIFIGNQICDDRPKTSAQHTRKVKTKDVKEAKKKPSNHLRKHATTLNAVQVFTLQSSVRGNTIVNLGL